MFKKKMGHLVLLGFLKNSNESEWGLKIKTATLNSQPIWLEVSFFISKFLIKCFSITKMYHSHSNSLNTVFTKTYGFLPVGADLVRITS